VLFLFTVYPGMLFFILQKLPIISRKSGFFQYLSTLFIVTIINGFLFPQSSIILIGGSSLLIASFGLFAVEYILVEKKYNNLIAVYRKNRVVIQSVVQFPLLEELIFRYFIYQHCLYFGFNTIQYVLLSTLSFVIAHMFYQGAGSAVKIIFSFSLNCVFLLTKDIFVVIAIHIIFNFFVYLMRISKYDKYRQ